ncbi:MAG: hypothetical protein HOD43_11310 [Candidatus Marinimicrobia bacterium]|jgi:hypothetical protein|nr:hypothetical protein [Candidatus Neomarinimicrobiota bacterium]MBT3630310.1 hypothetical protein [Candidatus Neomarinimicrobiota bacterium]MBT3824062.1 hypothetical protein [Candidatus Neomarinimicrobiota bacterium]MBT4132349.1 hypothetical protein [Candidatus Neomarinimicrobiota bacterium]MBT4296380.1 hypothetical protein [Candidatus Neomarinimicrobiota bacterium]
MKIRIPFAVALTALILWSCDEPIAYDNDSFTYNPFIFTEDTLNNVTSIASGDADIDWGSHFRSWIGDTDYYKSGFTVEFVFSDTALDIAGVDSINFQIQHVKTYPQDGSDTLGSTHSTFGYYETMDQAIDIESSFYGNFLGTDTMNISGGSNFWSYTLPADLIVHGDTSVSLGVFPAATDYLSSVYGGGSVSRPSLSFFFHEADSAGDDSATSITFLADTLHMHFTEKSTFFDRSQFEYISQLKTDSVRFTLNLIDFDVEGDTLQHIINSSILPAIDDMASALYMPDSVFRFSMSVEEPISGLTTTIEYGGDGYNANEVKYLVQAALDAEKTEMDLILRSTNPGYNPGYIAISKDVTQSALYVKASMAVQP